MAKKPSFSMSTSSPGMLPWLLWSAVIIVVDQLTKVLIIGNYKLGDVTPVTSFFNIVRAHNPGAAFSFLSDAGGWQRWFFTGIAFVAVAFILYMLKRHNGQRMFAFSLSCIMGGAIGNVIDRLWHGYVVDFLDFYYKAWHYPAFNVADAAITLGAVCLIVDELRRVGKS
jgi:signal peptidase II